MNQHRRVICCDMYFPSGCVGACFCGTPFPPPLERRVRHWDVISYTSIQTYETNVLERACGIMRQHARCALLNKDLETSWSRRRCQQRNETIKEDLIATFWHPSRVEKMLELGGWELVESY